MYVMYTENSAIFFFNSALAIKVLGNLSHTALWFKMQILFFGIWIWLLILFAGRTQKIYWCQHGNMLRDFEVLKEIFNVYSSRKLLGIFDLFRWVSIEVLKRLGLDFNYGWFKLEPSDFGFSCLVIMRMILLFHYLLREIRVHSHDQYIFFWTISALLSTLLCNDL